MTSKPHIFFHFLTIQSFKHTCHITVFVSALPLLLGHKLNVINKFLIPGSLRAFSDCLLKLHPLGKLLCFIYIYMCVCVYIYIYTHIFTVL